MEVTTHRGEGPLQQVIEIGKHRLLTDLAPELYARRKGWPLDQVKVAIRHGQEGDAYALHRTLEFVGALDATQKARLSDIANHCPVHKTLSGTIDITTQTI